jgi:transposase-like protein|tara:strand:+ start:1066 stop:1308 length:243 start_codon:yes stop_codon:yes gene_type:complete
MESITEFLNDNEDIWWNPQHPTYHAHEGRPSCQNCGKPADMNNKYSNGKIKWRDMCYDCHDHRTDKNYLATKFVGTSLPI